MIQLAVPHQYLGVAMGLVTTARNVGGSISSTVYTVILTNQLESNLGLNIATALANSGLPIAEIPSVTEAIATGKCYFAYIGPNFYGSFGRWNFGL
jgi:hypothetical protein